MAETADEYKERLIKRLEDDADNAARRVSYLEKHELPYAELAFRNVIADKIATENDLEDFLRTAATAVRDVEEW
jgi:hypothetical protein